MAVFYLCGKSFEVAAAFGCEMADAYIEAQAEFLGGMKSAAEPLTILTQIPAALTRGVAGQWLFGKGPRLHFLAAVQVAYEDVPNVGLLMVADNVPRLGLSKAQQFQLRAKSAEITSALELHGLRHPATSSSPAAWRFPLPDHSGKDAAIPSMITKAESAAFPAQRIVAYNEAFSRLTGYEDGELLGASPEILYPSQTEVERLEELYAALTRRRNAMVRMVHRTKNGAEYHADVRVQPISEQEDRLTQWLIFPDDGKTSAIVDEARWRTHLVEAEVAVLENEKAELEADIQERRRIEARLEYVAFHDTLTGLYNRQFFIDRLVGAIERLSMDPAFNFAVILVDLDRFKLVNDSFGHRAGDLMLIEIAQRLRKCTRADDVVARLGGDEFALLIEGFDKLSYVASVAERIVEVVGQPIHLSEQEVFSSASLGAAHATKYHRLPEDILRDADVAMYEAKRRNAGYLIFDDAMHRSLTMSTRLRIELQGALARSEFYLEYQPIVDLATRNLIGVEALTRWQHPAKGRLLPEAFIGTAEEMGIIRGIGAAMLREACVNMSRWQSQFPNLGVHLSFNISGHELADFRFISQLQDILKSTGVRPNLLQLEITESVLFSSTELVAQMIGKIKQLGVRVVLDDFGTGYSSLGYLDQYPIDGIKIDKSFLTGMRERPRTRSIVKAIIELANALALETTAEGVEEPGQIATLRSLGCKSAQGFLFGKPGSAENIVRLFEKQKAPYEMFIASARDRQPPQLDRRRHR